MAVNDEIREQTKKFKDMNKEQKADYIWTYYRWWILGVVFLILVIVTTTKTIIKNSKPVYLNAIFLNSTLDVRGTTCTLEKKFKEKLKISSDEYNDGFDYVTYLDDNYGNQQSMAGQVKVVSLYSAAQIDIITGPESVMLGAADVGGYGKLEEILPEGMLDELIEKGYEPFYYTEKVYDEDATPDENGDLPYTEGETYIGGLYIDNCEMLVGDKDTCVYSKGMDERLVLAITWNCENTDQAVEFVKFVTE